MVHRAHAVGGAAVVHVVADVDLASDDGMDAALFRLGVEIHDAVHDAVIRDGAGVHAQFFDAVQQGTDAVCAVQETVFGVQMKMCESHSVMLLVCQVNEKERLGLRPKPQQGNDSPAPSLCYRCAIAEKRF